MTPASGPAAQGDFAAAMARLHALTSELEAVRAHDQQLRRQISENDIQLEIRFEEIAELMRWQDGLEGQLRAQTTATDKAQERFLESEAAYRGLLGDVNRQHRDRAVQAREASMLRHELAESQQAVQSHKAQTQALRDEIEALRLSTSWKITRPLRSVMSRLRGH